MKRALRAVLLLLAIPVPVLQGAEPDGAGKRPLHAGRRIEQVIADIRAGESARAMRELDRLADAHPNFRLAHLLRGDLLLARRYPITALGNPLRPGGAVLEDLRAEAWARTRAPAPEGGLGPRYFLKTGPSNGHAVLVDASRFSAFVFDTSEAVPRLMRTYYTSIGRQGVEKAREGDRRTPIGVYKVTASIPAGKLPDFYGSGAFPIDYPNVLDRLAGRTGHGIWIHGVPASTYSRAPRASDGCLVLSNPDLVSLAAFVQPAVTPVVIARQIEWVAPAQLQAERDAILAQVEAWRKDWESGDTERYLEHYGKAFRTGSSDLAGWQAHKRRVGAQKTWIRVGLEKISAMREPGGLDLITLTFEQDYRSNNLSQRSHKRQHWALEGGRWKIVYEAPLAAPILTLPESYPERTRAARTTGGKA